MGASEVRVVDELDPATADHARSVLAASVTTEEYDDRFDAWPPTPSGVKGFIAALASGEGAPMGFLGGTLLDGIVQLDAIVDPEMAESLGGADTVLTQMLDALRPMLGLRGVKTVEIWAKPARPWHEAFAARHGLSEVRALHQMRCSLPVEAETVPTRAYRDADLEELRTVNNRAFAFHPDQGNQTVEGLRAAMAEPWFQAHGVRIYEREGRMAGFCWTKIHQSPPAAVELGEIYVIGVDPDYHGQGLGVPMTAAGLAWLAEQGISTGMLYVEADNAPALRTYDRLGFTILRTDRAWTLSLGETLGETAP